MATIILRMLLLLLSMTGYVMLLCKKIRFEFSIGLLFTAIGSLTFFAGIFNVLPESSLLILAGGILCLVCCAGRVQLFGKKPGFSLVFFFFGLCAFFIILYEKRFLHYDNFSHWAIVLKSILQNDRFPNALDKFVDFKSYPLGSASFIYYVVKVSGIHSEWMQMYAQAILMLGLMMGLFCFASGTAEKVFVSFGIVVLLCANISFVDLLVDTLLPVTALSALAYCVYAYDKEEHSTGIIWVLPWLTFLVSIKNSGLLFFALIVLFCAINVRRPTENIKALLVLCAVPLATLAIWKKHVELTFQNGHLSKHSMSIENFRTVFGEKSIEDITEIVRLFVTECISLHNIVSVSLILAILLCAFLFGRDKSQRRLLIYAMVSYLLYQIGSLGMYLFTMPTSEAINLASFDRYHATIKIFIAGLAVLSMVRGVGSLPEKKNQYKNLAVFCAAVMLCFSLKPNFQNYKVKEDNSAHIRYTLDSILCQHEVLPERKYLYLVESGYKDYGYLIFLSRYLLSAEDSSYGAASNIEEYERWKYYDYLITLTDDEEALSWLKERYDTDSPVVVLNERP